MKKSANHQSDISPLIHWVFYLLVFVVIFLVRSYYTGMPELADPLKKWRVALNLAATHDLSLLVSEQHHSSRWGVILPTALAIKMFGSTLSTYYGICLVFYSCVFTQLLFLASRSIRISLLLPFAVLLFYEPMMFRASSQLQAFIFGLLFSLTSYLCGYYGLRKKQLWLIIVAAVFGFFAYGSKETYIALVFGIGVFILLRGGIGKALVFSTALLVLLGLETIVFNLVSDSLMFGRIELLLESPHINLKMLNKGHTDILSSLPSQLSILPTIDGIVIILALVVTLCFLFRHRNTRSDSFVLGIMLMAWCYLLFICLISIKLDNWTHLQPFYIKYFTPTFPLLIYIGIHGVEWLFQNMATSTQKISIAGLNLIAVCFVIVVLLSGPIFTHTHSVARIDRTYPDPSAAMWNHEKLTLGLSENLGICAKRTASLELTRGIIKASFNQPELAKSLVISRTEYARILHNRNTTMNQLTQFVSHKNLFRLISKNECLAL